MMSDEPYRKLCTQHLAINDYDGHGRLMYRTTTLGKIPLSAREEGSAGAAP